MDLGNYEKFPNNKAITTGYRPQVKINKIYDDAHLPTYGSKCAACMLIFRQIRLICLMNTAIPSSICIRTRRV